MSKKSAAAQNTTSLDAFTEAVIRESFAATEARFGPIKPESKTQYTISLRTQLIAKVPPRFLGYLETFKNPKQEVEKILEEFNGHPPEYHWFPQPGEFDRNSLAGDVALKIGSYIVISIFGGMTATGEKGSGEFTPLFNQDLREIYKFIKQKREQAYLEQPLESGADGSSNGEGGKILIELRDEEKVALIQRFADSVFSIHALIKKVSKPDADPGQYL